MQQRAFLFSILECLHRVVYCCIEVCSLDKPLGIEPLPSVTDGLFLLSCRQRGRTAYICIYAVLVKRHWKLRLKSIHRLQISEYVGHSFKVFDARFYRSISIIAGSCRKFVVCIQKYVERQRVLNDRKLCVWWESRKKNRRKYLKNKSHVAFL